MSSTRKRRIGNWCGLIVALCASCSPSALETPDAAQADTNSQTQSTAAAAQSATAAAAQSATAARGASSLAKASATNSSTPSASAAATQPHPAAVPLPPIWLGKPAFDSPDAVDTIIAGGLVIDGSGSAATIADVVVDKGRVQHIGEVAKGVVAKTRVDATGLVVTPGFIDVHSHAAVAAANRNLLAMGVTTAVVGQDGRSPSKGSIVPWLNKMSHTRLAVNVATLVGHGTIRGMAHVGGNKPSDKQIAKMAKVLAQQLDAGAFGLSCGLEYQPGAQASLKELVGIAKPVAKRDAIIMSHMRSEDDDRIDASLDELLAQGKQGARVHVAHIKVVYGKGAKRAEALLSKLAIAREQGIEVSADIYPYNASYTTINIVFPAFAKPPASFQRARRTRRGELEEFLRKKIAQRGGPEATLFGSSPYTGKTLAQLAAEKQKPFEDVLIDDIGPGGASAAYFVMDDALQSRLLADPMVMVGTDGGSYSSHPRGHGSFARVIAEYVRKRQLLTLTEAVRKMSSLAAATVRLSRRGMLRSGAWADVLVFDPKAVQDRASYAKPHQLSRGMRWVFVNGRAAIANGKFTKRRNGQLLKSAPPKPTAPKPTGPKPTAPAPRNPAPRNPAATR